VEDKGVGFYTNANPGEHNPGLLGMRERAELLNGRLTIESGTESGTTLAAQFQSDLILLDLSMPSLGSLDALPMLRTLSPA
jgi:nitrate/nitrite-specific signal transduction histidine kinase